MRNGDLGILRCCLVVAMLGLAGCGDESGGDELGFRPGTDECLGSSDQALIATLTAPDSAPDGGVGDTLLGSIQEECARNVCFSEVLNSQVPPTCMRECMNATAAGAFTAGCLDCQIFNVTCAAELCVVPCLDSSGTSCTDCTNARCTPTFDACEGTPP